MGAGVAAEVFEGFVEGDLAFAGEEAFGLLDHDAPVEGGLELLGEALFGAYAKRETDPARAEKLRVLQRIEATTAGQLRWRRPLAGRVRVALLRRRQQGSRGDHQFRR